MLLLTPLIIKFLTNFTMSFGAFAVGRIISIIVGIFWVLFCVLSEGFSTTMIIQIIPGLVIIGLGYFIKTIPTIAGGALIALSLLGVYMYVTCGFDIYMKIQMITLIPVPLFVSGLFAIIAAGKNSTEPQGV